MNTPNSVFELRDLHFEYSPSRAFDARAAAFKSMPNNEKFDRNNRYEMILLINSLQKLWGLSERWDCEKIEYMIKVHLPEQ